MVTSTLKPRVLSTPLPHWAALVLVFTTSQIAHTTPLTLSHLLLLIRRLRLTNTHSPRPRRSRASTNPHASRRYRSRTQSTPLTIHSLRHIDTPYSAVAARRGKLSHNTRTLRLDRGKSTLGHRGSRASVDWCPGRAGDEALWAAGDDLKVAAVAGGVRR